MKTFSDYEASATQKTVNSIGRVQKSAARIMLGNAYSGYNKPLAKLGMDTLKYRRGQLCLNFAKKLFMVGTMIRKNKGRYNL